MTGIDLFTLSVVAALAGATGALVQYALGTRRARRIEQRHHDEMLSASRQLHRSQKLVAVHQDLVKLKLLQQALANVRVGRSLTDNTQCIVDTLVPLLVRFDAKCISTEGRILGDLTPIERAKLTDLIHRSDREDWKLAWNRATYVDVHQMLLSMLAEGDSPPTSA